MSAFSFTVQGDPAPQGSKSLGRNRRTGKPILYESSKAVKPWREAVSYMARIAKFKARVDRIDDGPVRIAISFRLERPAKTFRTEPYIKPDLDKLVRSTLDALSGVLYRDDEQVCELTVDKMYIGERHGTWEPSADFGSGAMIVVRPMHCLEEELAASRKNREENERRRLTRRTKRRKVRPNTNTKESV